MASLVVDEAITKPDAFRAIAEALRSRITQPRSARPFVTLASGDWAEVDIPKFGEAPPLTIDVYSLTSAASAASSAAALMAQLVAHTGWRIQPMLAR